MPDRCIAVVVFISLLALGLAAECETQYATLPPEPAPSLPQCDLLYKVCGHYDSFGIKYSCDVTETTSGIHVNVGEQGSPEKAVAQCTYELFRSFYSDVYNRNNYTCNFSPTKYNPNDQCNVQFNLGWGFNDPQDVDKQVPGYAWVYIYDLQSDYHLPYYPEIPAYAFPDPQSAITEQLRRMCNESLISPYVPTNIPLCKACDFPIVN